MEDNILLAYFGHHKCATTWIGIIVKQMCDDMHLKTANVYESRMFNDNLDLFIKENFIDFLVYTNADIRYVQSLNNFLGFHVVRDPRDIVVSAYFSHLYSHSTQDWSELVDYRAKLQNASRDDGLMLEMDFRKKQFEEMYNWDYSQPNVLEVKMEDLIKYPYDEMAKVFSFLQVPHTKYNVMKTLSFLLTTILNRIQHKSKGIFPFYKRVKNIPMGILLGYVHHYRFSTLAEGRKQGQENSKSHFRKGIAGDWANHFNTEHRAYFKKNYNDLLLKLGYEKSSNW